MGDKHREVMNSVGRVTLPVLLVSFVGAVYLGFPFIAFICFFLLSTMTLKRFNWISLAVWGILIEGLAAFFLSNRSLGALIPIGLFLALVTILIFAGSQRAYQSRNVPSTNRQFSPF